MASLLFSPLTIRGVEFRNRIWVSPMCQYMCLEHDGLPHDWHLVNAGQYAAGGVGMFMTEATAVSPEGRITSECAGIWNGDQRDQWARVAAFVRSQGAVPAMQLAHAGRKASDYRGFTAEAGKTKPIEEGGWTPVSPSAVACPGFDTPQELDTDGVDKIVADYRAAARRAVDAGFEVIEIHAAHGYLLHSFLSPLSNFRTDEYGGSLENRARILLRIASEIREEIPEAAALFIRFSATDWVEDGLQPGDTAQVASWAADIGVDFFDISSGGIVRDIFISVAPGYQVPLTEKVRELGNVKAAAVGKITTAAHAEEILQEGRADAIFIAREFTRDPHFVFRAAHDLGETLDYIPLSFRASDWSTG